ncbi:MAG: hypothetical protein L3J18_16430 [Candidatus Brocadia sp.]|jgi:hypothetical protein|nr:MAG: hypothetical protein L3J18_16430 [Candidatus Brocadia sp.]
MAAKKYLIGNDYPDQKISYYNAPAKWKQIARNDNARYGIKDIATVIARVLSEAISRMNN